MENMQCPPPTCSFTTDNAERRVITFNTTKEADAWLFRQKEDATTKSIEIKNTKSLIKKSLRNTLCKINIHDTYVYPNVIVCLNCGKITSLNNVEYANKK